VTLLSVFGLFFRAALKISKGPVFFGFRRFRPAVAAALP
jgi:hypothetical protein